MRHLCAALKTLAFFTPGIVGVALCHYGYSHLVMKALAVGMVGIALWVVYDLMLETCK